MKQTLFIVSLLGLFVALVPTTEVISANYPTRHSEQDYREFHHTENHRAKRSHQQNDSTPYHQRTSKQTNRHCH